MLSLICYKGGELKTPFTFPHFGSLRYVFEAVAYELGRKDVIIPNKPSKKTKQLGAMHSPEFICTPFKITLGTFIESLERGADELGMGGCNAFCRFGYYWPVQKLILEDLGFNFKFLPLDYFSPWQIVKQFKKCAGKKCTLFETIRALRIGWLKNRLTDLTDQLIYRYRAIELEKDSTDLLANQIFRDIVEVKRAKNIFKMMKTIPKRFEKEIEIDKKAQPLKVVVNGEIYVVLEPAMNLDVHKRLNELGVVVENPVTLRRFIDVGEKLNPFKRKHWIESKKAAKEIVPYRCGGETQENIGDVILYKKENFDGLVHLYPFTCMPEIISRSIFPQLSHLYDMPILSLVVDEQTAEAGFQTRLEAFIDLIERKRLAKKR